MQCPKCKASTSVLRSQRVSSNAKRRFRTCMAPACSFRFTTIETTQGSESPIQTQMRRDAAIHLAQKAALGEKPAQFDREALIAALTTDRRRAEIARQLKATRRDIYPEDYEVEEGPAFLSHEDMHRELGQ